MYIAVLLQLKLIFVIKINFQLSTLLGRKLQKTMTFEFTRKYLPIKQEQRERLLVVLQLLKTFHAILKHNKNVDHQT